MFDVAVVGLGGMGSAVAANAAQRGLRVLGLEQFKPGHDLGASSGETRLIRKAYFEDPAYVPLLLRAYELWRLLEAKTGIELLHVTGLLILGRSDSTSLLGARKSAKLHGLLFEELSPNQIRERYPAVKVRADEIGFFEPDAGFVRPEAAIRAHLQVARTNGAHLRFETRVERWEAIGDERIEVFLADGEKILTRTLALCKGPWFVKDAADLGVQLRIQRNVQAWFRSEHERFHLGSLPAFFADRSDYPKPLYGFPDIGTGLKAAFHGYGETTCPELLRRETNPSEIERLRSAVDDLLPGAGGRLLASKVCMYSLTPDEHFVIAARADCPNAIVAGGFSGHGYKFCSVVGEAVADLLESGKTGHDIAFLSPRRFTATT